MCRSYVPVLFPHVSVLFPIVACARQVLFVGAVFLQFLDDASSDDLTEIIDERGKDHGLDFLSDLISHKCMALVYAPRRYGSESTQFRMEHDAPSDFDLMHSGFELYSLDQLEHNEGSIPRPGEGQLECNDLFKAAAKSVEHARSTPEMANLENLSPIWSALAVPVDSPTTGVVGETNIDYAFLQRIKESQLEGRSDPIFQDEEDDDSQSAQALDNLITDAEKARHNTIVVCPRLPHRADIPAALHSFVPACCVCRRKRKNN